MSGETRISDASRSIGRDIGIILLLLIVAFSLRLPFAGSLFFNVDEAHDAVGAHIILGGGIPYRDVAGHRGPLIYYLLASVFALFGRFNMPAVHVSLALLVAASAYLLYRLGRQLRNGSCGLVAALAFLYGSFNYRPGDTLAFHTEFPMVFFTSAAMLFFAKGWLRNKGRDFFFCGVSLAAAVLFKQAAFMDLGAALFALTAGALGGERRKAGVFHHAAALLAGFGAAALLTVVFFLGQGAWKDFVDLFWNYNVNIYGPSCAPGYKLKWAMTYPLHRSLFFGRNAPLSLSLAGFAVMFLQRMMKSKKEARELVERDFFLGLWLCFAYAGASLSGRHFGHYYLQVLPPACLAAGFFLVWVWEAIPARFQRPGAGAAFLLAGFLFAASFWRMRGDLDLREPYDLRAVSAYVRENSTEKESIYVWGFLPQIYFMAERRPASRYLVSNFMSGAVPFANNGLLRTGSAMLPGARDIFMKDLAASPPRFILDTSPGNYFYYAGYPIENFPELQTYLERYYILDRTFYETEGRPLCVFRRLADTDRNAA